MTAPMISVPLKATNEIDWIIPLKSYIKHTYGDDPERYAEECATLNRLRQDMRGAGRDSMAGRDLLYRYYGQLELLDLRFPVDEQHIKISFTWYDAFTHKATAQHSLAFEKASIIFNISAVLSCHAAVQARTEDTGLKAAYHSFQASAGMFTYINENFLHAPSADLSRDTVKTLISLMLAQAQEVFVEKQVADQKKPGLLAKLSSQAATLYGQAMEGIQDNVNRAIFEKVWLLVAQTKYSMMNSMGQYYQAVADDDANSHGLAIARLQMAESLGKEAARLASAFPASIPPNSNLPVDCGTTLLDMAKRHLVSVQETLKRLNKDNDYIYHQTVPAEASVPPVPKLPASKPIPVSELYAGQDIQRITGPDLFAKIVPLAVTESASLYDEEKAKLIRAEQERVDVANGEMAAGLDYLKLPGALQNLKGMLEGWHDPLAEQEDDFRTWCIDVADREEPNLIFESLQAEKQVILSSLGRSAKQLDTEESVCEKMRSKYAADWTQQASSRLTTTLRDDIRSYREALEEASRSDGQLAVKLRANNSEFDDMRSAAQSGEIDALFQNALGKGRKSDTAPTVVEENLLDAEFDDDGPSVADQIEKAQDMLKKLNLIKRERLQVLKDLKDKARTDDISQILILNKKSLANYEQQLFQQMLERYRPYQNRLTQANHKQSALLKELATGLNKLLQDKRVRTENSRFELLQRQRGSVMSRYKQVYQDFLDLEAGLQSAKKWYGEMKETVESLEKNVESFVNNRRLEGAQLLKRIEQDRAANKSTQAAMEQERLRELMERMALEAPLMSPSNQGSVSRGSPSASYAPSPRPYPTGSLSGQYQGPQMTTPRPQRYSQGTSQGAYNTYNPSSHGRIPGPASPPASQTSFHISPLTEPTSLPATRASHLPQSHNYSDAYGSATYQQPPQLNQAPPGFVLPPPPLGPPPLGPQQTIHYESNDYHGLTRGVQMPRPVATQQQAPAPTQGDPWAGLSAWK